MKKKRRNRIAFIKRLKKFGESELGLDFAGSFEKFKKDYRTANWLYVVRRDRLESALPENETFLFFWDVAKARRKENYFRKKKFHTYLYSAEAHGGGKCPVTPALLEASRARQAYVVLHEAWHSTCRIGGIGMPYALEEATGRVVGVMGAVKFADMSSDDELMRECAAQARDWKRFSGFINRNAKLLDKLYSGKSSARARKELFRKARHEAAGLRVRTDSAWEREELTREMNNALFFRYRDYTKHYPLALGVYESSRTLPAAMNRFMRAAREGALKMLRKA